MYAHTKMQSTSFVVLAVGHGRKPLAQVPGTECRAFLAALNERMAGQARYWARELKAGEASPALQFANFAEYLEWKAPEVPHVATVYTTAEQAAWDAGSAARQVVIDTAPMPVGYTGAAAAAMARITKVRKPRKAKAA